MTKEEQINNIMDCFDFDKVHKAMVALDWKWGMHGGFHIPAQRELRKRAREILRETFDKLEEAEDSRSFTIETGGFEARATSYDNEDIKLELRFSVSTWENFKSNPYE